jgi:hypothetical protein
MMKKALSIFSLVLILAGCGVTIESIVDSNLRTAYKKPLFVLFYEEYSTDSFTGALKYSLQQEFNAQNIEAKVLRLEHVNEELSLNSKNDAEIEISQAVVSGASDFVIIVSATGLRYQDGMLNSATFQLVGIDTSTNREVWKAKLKASSAVGPSLFVEQAARKIMEQLKIDRVL